MNYIYVGKIVNTHGIKGELRIISNFEKKELVFSPNVNIYITDDKIKETITSYRHHKNYEMIMLKGYNNINDVLKYKNKKVYIIKEEFKELDNTILKEDLIGMEAYIDDKKIGIVIDIYNTGLNNEVVEIKTTDKKILIPYHKDFIKEIDISLNKIVFKGGVI